MAPGLKRTVAACALALACAASLAACGEHDPGVDEPAREGLAIDVGGIDYNVFLTRELNLEITPDEAYYEGPEAPPGEAYYGVFIQVCNRGGETTPATDDFVVEDNQGTQFEPLELEQDNAFAYRPRELADGECIPQEGSVAEQGPTAAALLMFQFPLEAVENRPLELIISDPSAAGEADSKRVELDL